MSDKALSSLTEAASIPGSGYVYGVVGGNSRKILIDELRGRSSVLNSIPVELHAAIANYTSNTDVSAYVQDAIDEALASGRASIFFPDGRYFFAEDGDPLDPGVGGLAFTGESREGTHLIFEEGDAALNSGLEKYLFYNNQNITKKPLTFENLKIKGHLDVDLAQGGGNVTQLRYYPFVTVRNCWVDNVKRIGFEFLFCGGLEAYSNRFTNVARDALRARDTPYCNAHHNFFQRVGDDSIAFHTQDAALETWSPIRQGLFACDNILVNAGIVKLLGGRTMHASRNIMDLCNINCIQVGNDGATNLEGSNPTYDIAIDDNILSNLVNITSATPAPGNAYITCRIDTPRGAVATHSTIPGRWDSTDNLFIKPWDWYDRDTTDTDNAVPPTPRISICRNKWSRNRPEAANFSDYGYGSVLRLGTAYDPAVDDDDLRPASGVAFVVSPGYHQLLVADNQGEHTVDAVALPAPTSFWDYQNVKIARNTFFDTITRGIDFDSPGGLINVNVEIDDNVFDLDPWRENSNSNTDGTYDANGTPQAINLGNVIGVAMRRNTFRNCCQTIASNSITSCIVEDNVIQCSAPAALGFNSGNKGVGAPIVGYGRFRYEIIDADPTSATYGALTNILLDISSAKPASGWYPAGWFVWDSAPAVATGRIGWLRVTTGTGHDLNVDWIEVGNRSQSLRVVTAAGAVTMAANDDVVVVNKTVGAATTVNLPSSPSTSQRHTIKDGKGDAATNNITVTPAAGTIDGASTFVMNANYHSIGVVYNGTEWNVI